MRAIDTEQRYRAFLVEHHRPAQAGRTAARVASSLLPHLAPGMVVLDLGCGPGSITAGLAEAVHPGTAVGVDLRPGPAPVPLATADVMRLPLRDAAVDAVFAHTLLQHVADPLAVVREAVRVAKPGAPIALADADWGGSVLAPDDPLLRRGEEIRLALRRGTDPFVGRRLRGLLAQAGCERTEAEAQPGVEGRSESTALAAAFEAAWFDAPAVVDHVVALGLSSAEELAAIAAAWSRWGADPGAVRLRTMWRAIGWVPA